MLEIPTPMRFMISTESMGLLLINPKFLKLIIIAAKITVDQAKINENALFVF